MLRPRRFYLVVSALTLLEVGQLLAPTFTVAVEEEAASGGVAVVASVIIGQGTLAESSIQVPVPVLVAAEGLHFLMPASFHPTPRLMLCLGLVRRGRRPAVAEMVLTEK